MVSPDLPGGRKSQQNYSRDIRSNILIVALFTAARKANIPVGLCWSSTSQWTQVAMLVTAAIMLEREIHERTSSVFKHFYYSNWLRPKKEVGTDFLT
jgi:hypothetical protein